MKQVEIEKLKSHPMNSYYFDDMTGESWDAFVESIRTSGVIEPVIVTEDMVIVSGHQRVRACKQLGLSSIIADIRHYDAEDQIMKDLIETNIRQRGVGNTNPIKFGRCVAELERIYGISHGNNQYTERSGQNVASSKTQDDLAEELGITKRNLQRYKSLTDLIPELQDAVQSGQITATTAMGFVKKLSPDEQRQLAEQISGKEKVSQREIDFYTNRIKELTAENNALRSRPPEVREVVPSDYENIKAENASLRSDKIKLTKDNEKLKAQASIKHDKYNIKVDEDTEMFIMKVYTFIKDVGGYVWLTEQVDKISEDKLPEFRSAVNSIAAFGQQMIQNMGGYTIE